MKNTKARNAGFLACAIALSGLLGAAPADAQYRDRRDVLTDSSYERMRRWARELDQVAERANRQAQAQQAGYRGFSRDGNFLRSIDRFARKADQFDSKMNTYRTRPWNVDEELRELLRDARTVQTRINRARFVDTRTRRDWERVVSLLGQMSTEYRAAVDGRYDRYPNGRYDDRYPDGRYDDRYPDGRYDDDDRYPNSDSRVSSDLRQLAYDLDRRAARVNDLASRSAYDRYGEYTSIRRFSETARGFRSRVDRNGMSRTELRREVNRLLEDADRAYADIRNRNLSRELYSEWEGIVQILERMRSLA